MNEPTLPTEPDPDERPTQRLTPGDPLSGGEGAAGGRPAGGDPLSGGEAPAGERPPVGDPLAGGEGPAGERPVASDPSAGGEGHAGERPVGGEPGPEVPRGAPGAGGGPEAPWTEPLAGAGPRRLTRSSSDRILGGVAGGLGRHLNVDPVLFRIGFVVLAFAGGAGVLAYLAALLFIPSDDPNASGLTGRAATITGGALLALAVAVLLGGPFLAFAGPGLFVAALAVGGLVLLARSRRGGDAAHVAGRVLLGLLLLGAACIGAFAVGIAAALGGGEVIAGLLVLTGLAMIVAAFVGGARWMILPAVVVAVPLAAVAALDIDMTGGVGDREYRPTSVAELRDGYELGAGELRLDLRDVALPQGTTNLDLRVGLGVAEVLVPRDVCVGFDAAIGAGFVDVLDDESAGLDLDISHRPSPRTSDNPVLILHTDIGAGGLSVGHDSFSRFRDGPPWRDGRGFDDIVGDEVDTACARRS